MQDDRFDSMYSGIGPMWARITPPWRPSVKETEFVETKILSLQNKLGRRPKILLLGSTPEFRDICSLHGFELTILDFKQEMFEALKQFLRYKPENEKLVIGNWLEADKIFGNERFDAIIGDRPADNINFSEYSVFFRALSGILSEEGIAIILFSNNNIEEGQITLDEFIEKCDDSKNGCDIFANKIIALYQIANFLHAYSKDNYQLDWNILRNNFVKEMKSKGFSTDKINSYWGITDSVDDKVLDDLIETTPPFGKTLEEMEKNFRVDEIFDDKSADFMRIKKTVCASKK